MTIEEFLKFVLWVSATRKIVANEAAGLIVELYEGDKAKLNELIATFYRECNFR